MRTREEQIGFAVSEEEKQMIRQAAAAADMSMAAFARERVLSGLSVEEVSAAPVSEDLPPLEDFKGAAVAVDSDADPVPKKAVYEHYVEFCERLYPDHTIETQHKVSREIAAMDSVETGRVYLSTAETNPTRTRCFKNIRLQEPA